MNKLLKICTAALLAVFAMGSTAAAQVTCSITNTGAGSNNTCEVTEDTKVTVTCENGVKVTNANSQYAESGSVTVSGNRISGNATSGDAENRNQLANDLALNCAAAPAPAPTPSPTPPTGGAGGGEVLGAAAPVGGRGAAEVAALPETSSSTPAVYAGVATAVLGSLALASRIGVSALGKRFQE